MPSAEWGREAIFIMRNPAALGPAWMGASGGSSVAEKGQIQRCGMRLAPV